MSVTFIHTADWQLGKPFGSVEDEHKRALLQQERLAVIDRIGTAAADCGAGFILVAGDLFDSPHPTNDTVAAACHAIGALRIPVLVIPGNHDHAGPGCVWEQPFFKSEHARAAPNLTVLLQPEPVETPHAIVLPCPLLHRHDLNDPTAWLRVGDDALAALPADKPRIVLAHGAVQAFGADLAAGDDDEPSTTSVVNYIDLARLPAAAVDYVAIGDWHGMKEVAPKAWYSGAPETDRFPRGVSYQSGHVLAVTASRAAQPNVSPVRTGRVGWHILDFDLADETLPHLEARVEELLAGRVTSDLLDLSLNGSLGIEATARLESLLESWSARLLRLKLRDSTVLAPSDLEIEQLCSQTQHPLIARVAATLVERAKGTGEDACVARVALRELHAFSAVR